MRISLLLPLGSFASPHSHAGLASRVAASGPFTVFSILSASQKKPKAFSNLAILAAHGRGQERWGPAASNIVVEAFRVAWQIQAIAAAPHYQRRQLEGSDPAGIPAREPRPRKWLPH